MEGFGQGSPSHRSFSLNQNQSVEKLERSQLRQRPSGSTPPFFEYVLEDVLALGEGQDLFRRAVIHFGNKPCALMRSTALQGTPLHTINRASRTVVLTARA